MSALMVADMPAEWRRWHPGLASSHPVHCEMPMQMDVHAGTWPLTYRCLQCGASVGGEPPEPSVLEERARRVPTAWIVAMGAREARRAWEQVEREDARDYEAANPLREER